MKVDREAAGGIREASAEDVRRLRSGYLRFKSALHDRITGLYSYQVHVDTLQMACDGRRLGVVVLDFPSLAPLEATYGWEMGDRFLSGTGSLLAALRGRILPEDCLLALDGVGGNCFLIFLPGLAEGVEQAATALGAIATDLGVRFRRRLETAEWAPPPGVDLAIGHALVSGNAAARFERRLQQAIREARSMTADEHGRMQDARATELRGILDGARLTTFYQPIVDMEQGVIMGYEALTRGPANSLLEVPEALFSCSDAIRLSPELDALCRQQAVLNARGFDPSKKLFLNALPETLQAPGFKGDGLGRVLEEVALRPQNLVLEITERCAILDFEVFCRELTALRREGFLVAIDDVGTGYSSLQSITEVQPDFLKIDISLIKNVHQSLIKQELVHSMLQVASRIGARVIAEGIESEEEYRTLRICGVRYGQGFYFARPAPAFPTIIRGRLGSA
jgi:EAL domain-containing protein (putative c-di-GMP-specific phosphodiesterase class I)